VQIEKFTKPVQMTHNLCANSLIAQQV